MQSPKGIWVHRWFPDDTYTSFHMISASLLRCWKRSVKKQLVTSRHIRSINCQIPDHRHLAARHLVSESYFWLQFPTNNKEGQKIQLNRIVINHWNNTLSLLQKVRWRQDLFAFFPDNSNCINQIITRIFSILLDSKMNNICS